MSESTMAVTEADLRRSGEVFPETDSTRVYAGSRPQAITRRDAALDYLRAFVVVLVVAHHSVIAYARILPTVAPRDPLHPWLGGIPIVDSHRVIGFDLFGLFNDLFFMSLLFFLSGLFVWPSLARKGSAKFLRDRGLRLGLPFLLALLLMPLAYYAAYLAGASNASFEVFWREWLSLGFWPSGPAWFVAVLLAFDAVAVTIHRLTPGLFPRLGRLTSSAFLHPARFFAGFMIVSAVAYLPMLATFGGGSWAHFGPFTVQSSRFLHYALYFFVGIAVGTRENGHSLVARNGRLAQRWPAWLFAAVAMFAIAVTIMVAIRPMAAANGLTPLARQLIMGLAFVLCCGTISFAVLALFRRFANTCTPALDSLSRNSYGIYLVHYGFVLWLQYALLPMALPAVPKAAAVLALALAASWMATAALRRIPAVARVI